MNIYKDTIQAITPRARIEYEVFILSTDVKNIEKYEMRDRFAALCREGCENYERKWSCPPYAPAYHEFTGKFKNISVCLALARLGQFDYIKNDYLKIKAANTILKSRTEKALRKLIERDVYYISSGSCRLCKPCRCKMQEPCAHPGLMTYSFEALGIDVEDMVHDLFGIPLLWYSKGSLPEYTSVAAGLLSKDKFDTGVIINTLRDLN